MEKVKGSRGRLRVKGNLCRSAHFKDQVHSMVTVTILHCTLDIPKRIDVVVQSSPLMHIIMMWRQWAHYLALF